MDALKCDLKVVHDELDQSPFHPQCAKAAVVVSYEPVPTDRPRRKTVVHGRFDQITRGDVNVCETPTSKVLC
jgi:hypothetical protein